MKCKECREKIPDNVKYCPECGALINKNGGSFRYYQNNTDNEHRYPEKSSQFPFQNIPQKNRTSRSIPLKGILLIVIALIFGGSVLLLSFNTMTDWGSSVVVDIDEDLNYVENVAYDYAVNIVDCESFQSTDTFRTQTLIEWNLVCRDYFRNTPENTVTSAVNEEELFAKSENCLNSVFENINSRYNDDFEPFYFYLTTLGVYSLSIDQTSFYHSIISSYLAGIGLDADTYYDRDQISNIYCVDFSVTAENDDCDETHEFGNIQVIVAQIYDDYYVLYDDVFIQTLLDSI